MKIKARIVLCVCIIAFSIVGCSGKRPDLAVGPAPENQASPEDLQGSVQVESIGKDTKVSYAFKNQSKKKVTVIGGAKYTLMKDHKTVEEGSVPVIDYIDLEPGKEYKASKTFSDLQSGDYVIRVEWNKTIVDAAFHR